MTSEKIIFRHDDIHGMGDIYFVWQPNHGQLIATTGTDQTVAIFNRQGQIIERIILQGFCSGFAWETEGDLLAISTSNSSQIMIWDANSQSRQMIDTGLRDPPSCLIWSKTSTLLAVGTSRGNLTLYNHLTTRRVPVLGKHSKKVTCGAWNDQNTLALGSEDRTFSINNEEGDSLRIVQVRDMPSDVTFAEMKHEDHVAGQNTISMILGKRTLYLYYMPEPDSPTELGFQPKYGQLLQHKWFGDGFILLGFSQGNLVVISTNPKDVGQELWQVKNHRDSLCAIALSNEVGMVASCGDNSIKMHSTKNLQETTKILTLPDQTKNIAWSSDGQLLAVSTQQGAICVFVTQMETLYSVSAPKVALMTNLTEVSLFHYGTEKIKQLPSTINLEIEPSFIALGPFHFACGMNNHVWFYDLGRGAEQPIGMGDREYMTEIKEIALSAQHCAAHCGGQIILHAIDSSSSNEPKVFPEEIMGMQENVIICMALTNNFLCFATDLGNIVHFSLEQWSVVVKYRHEMGIKQILPDLDGIKVMVIDEQGQGFVYLPTTEDMVKIPELAKSTEGAVWDLMHPNVFITYDTKICTTYVYVPMSVKGKYVQKVGQTKLLSEQIPIMLYDGDLCLNSGGSRVVNFTLSTHKNNPSMSLEEQLEQSLNLRRWASCWELCKLMDKVEQWKKVGRTAISDADVQLAIKIFRQIEDAGTVYALEEIQYIEDANLLAGHCALLLDDIETAKSFFTRSFNPKEALELCRDLLQWEQALAIAATLAPDEVPFIAREYAQQLEFSGNYSEALMNYERARKVQPESDPDKVEMHLVQCKMGIARMSIRTGDYRRGIELAQDLNDKTIFKEAGEALIDTNRTSEAAIMMEKAEHWDKAAQFYIQLKQWNRVDQILPKVTSLKLHALYAAAKESEGKYTEAINSYRTANELDNVVRIYIDHLNDPHSASEIVLETRSVEGSKLLAKFYQSIGDYESAIQFLVLCGCISNAFELAQKYNKVRQYGEALEQYDVAKSSDFRALAQYFEAEKYTLLTGKYYFLAKEYSKALKHLLKASSFSNDEQPALSLAIDCAATSNDERLVNQLIQFLLGDNDGVPKDPKFLFRLYMARKQYREAAKTAVIIANQEQISGNYRVARDLLYSMYQELKRNDLGIATDMRYSLNLLHRYALVRYHIKLDNHRLAALLLIQIASNISQFPSHIVPILTSTVIECQRAGLKQMAYKNAVTLMRPENRGAIDSKYAKKVEAIVRKAPRGIKEVDDDLEQETSPCPGCGYDLQIMDTICSQCKASIPICIATGKHIVKKGLVMCPECDFPAIKDEMMKLLDAFQQCPMCNENVDSNRLIDIEDGTELISI